MILWFLFGLYWNWPTDGNRNAIMGHAGGSLLLFVLLGLLGWKTFGPVLQ